MTEKKEKIGDLQINYKISGEGEPLLILHGWGGSSDSWTQVQKVLSLRYKTICPDLPGFGKSDSPDDPWNVSDYLKWTIAFLDHLKIKNVYLIAHSFGGRIAIKMSATKPKKVSKMILCSPAGVLGKTDAKNRIIKFAVKTGKRFFFSDSLKNLSRKIVYLLLRRRDYVKVKGVMKETFRRVIEEDLSPYLKKIKAKTLIIWGKKDRMVPVKQSHFFNKKIKNSELKVLPKRGHSPHLEEPEELVELFINFLRR